MKGLKSVNDITDAAMITVKTYWVLVTCQSCAKRFHITSFNPHNDLSLRGTITYHPLIFPGGSDGKESTCSAGDLGSVPESGRPPPLEKEVATHSHILAWRIPWTGDPGGLQSMGSQRVGHDWETNALTFHFHIYQIGKPKLRLKTYPKKSQNHKI